MPFTGRRGWNEDMPALWALNVHVPLTLQYGNPECSCWPLCGEMDVLEVLAPGNDKCISSLHPLGGSASYFSRPGDQAIKLAVVFSEISGTLKIEVLDDDQGFDQALSDERIEQFFGDGQRGAYVALH